MDNKLIVERIFAFASAVRRRNDTIAQVLLRATIPLLEYSHPLQSASRDDLLGIAGIGPATVQFIQRIIAGEDIDTVVAEVPEIQKHSSGPRYRPTESKENTWETKHGTGH